jgi:hypothetical protein
MLPIIQWTSSIAALCWAPLADPYIPSYLGGCDREDHVYRPACANSLQDSIFKIIREEWTRGMAQVVEHLLSILSQTPIPTERERE